MTDPRLPYDHSLDPPEDSERPERDEAAETDAAYGRWEDEQHGD